MPNNEFISAIPCLKAYVLVLFRVANKRELSVGKNKFCIHWSLFSKMAQSTHILWECLFGLSTRRLSYHISHAALTAKKTQNANVSMKIKGKTFTLFYLCENIVNEISSDHLIIN